MADERTQSTFTWLNSVSRNRQHLHTMVSQAQIRQYYHSPQPVSQVSAHYINIQLNQVHGQTHSHHARGSHGQSTIRFSEINSQLRNDTRARHPSGSTTDTRIVAAVPEDGSVDDGVMNPWLDDKPEHCGHAFMFDNETYIDLDRPELLAILSSDAVEHPHETPAKTGLSTSTRGADSTKDGELSERAAKQVDWDYNLAL